MNEEWKKEYFEWKDEIEGKFNSLSGKISNPEWLDVLILDLMKPQITDLKEQFEKVENYYENVLTEHERHIAEDLIEPKIAELKEQVKYLEDRYKESGGLKCLRDRGLIKEVLGNSIRISRNAFLQIKAILRDSDLMKVSTVEESYNEQLVKLDSKPKTEKKEVDITNMVLKRCPYCTELFSLDVNTLVVRGNEDSGAEEDFDSRDYRLVKRRDLKELIEIGYYGDDKPEVVEFLERMKEAYGIE